MADIKIDVSKAIAEIQGQVDGLEQDVIKDVQTAMGQLSRMVYNEAVRLASERLHTQTPAYISALKHEKVNDNTYIIYIEENSFAQKLEEGWASYDMKPGFLKSSKAKQGKKGKYLDVPLPQHPFSKKSGGTQKIKDMKSAVESVLKDKGVSKRIEEFNSDSSGLAKYGEVTRFDGIKDPAVQGLVKITPPGQKQGNYLLFRRVSSNSDPQKWIHPGYAGMNIFDNELKDYAEKELKNILNTILG